jgi:hypothetical protein
MGVQSFPTPASGGIKSVQRGSAASAGTVTITTVDITKSFVNVFGTTSSGTVAASGSINAVNASINAATGSASAATGTNSNVQFLAGNDSPQGQYAYIGSNQATMFGGFRIAAGTINTNAQNIAINSTTAALNAANISGGSNNLVAAVVQGYLSGPTSLVVSGACRWEVVEFN